MYRSPAALALLSLFINTLPASAQHSGYNEDEIERRRAALRTSDGVAKEIENLVSQSKEIGPCTVSANYSARTVGGKDAGDPAFFRISAMTQSGARVSVSFDLVDVESRHDEVQRVFSLKSSEATQCDHLGCKNRREIWVILSLEKYQGGDRRLTLLDMSGHSQMTEWKLSRIDC